MHMADALISPAVGGAMWAASAGLAAYSIKKVQADIDEKKAPLMGVMGAFVFAAQMINFTIPGTGSSGHIGGGLLLAIILGPYAGFLTMAAILTIQALFFADGGLLALGCNIFNMGFFTCFVVYPLIYKKIIQKGYSQKRILFACMTAVILGLQMGALGVVLETLFSGITELPFSTFLLLMQPIHLAIGIVEGLVVAAVVSYVWRERPEIIERALSGRSLGGIPVKKVMTALVIMAVITGGVLSWFASANPDGLEWSMFKTAGVEELEAKDGIHQTLAGVQENTAFLPDYGFKATEDESAAQGTGEDAEESWPAVSAGTSVSGLVGGGLTLALAALAGLVVSKVKKRQEKAA
ncbi:cobalamin (vitamin B12) biosynthesis CbiM protein [Syntrophobotulus glycolicus DSM 8271]|uniref:Cobalamin (Vitamin B12) biosynthesis CbiM protein n=1 Tax=Syntrophobotulus glycolicus (strain DSM 8271 / FlGlyR) TaxID=645991 RepID=F0T2V4_SYNGF|nr:energy-coupling factor ABC transporter permease [Syntrophobotulus glycolicus]ADY57591.1 cobalamin (vitamin B12) biosynthesis CbiM protein [Syntrophobotulus glycolicus DSM 8271]